MTQRGIRLRESDGSELAVVSGEDSIVLYVKSTKVARSLVISPKTAMSLAWFLVWHVVICTLWLGIRPRLLRRKLQKRLALQAGKK